MLSQIGWLLLPSYTLKKLYSGKKLGSAETKTLNMNPRISADLIKNIPRLEPVAEIILYQNKHFDGTGQPDDKRWGELIPLGSRILKVALDFDLMEAQGITKGDALTQMHDRTGWYDPEVMEALGKVVGHEKDFQIREVKVFELKARMILDQDVRSTKGQLLIPKGRQLNAVALSRLRYYERNSSIQQPIRVLVPIQIQKNMQNRDKRQ
jgi:HD-GYP domain-containing protein (c-di-GMP phosphodiesterase class II)